jgi:CDP-6-deoxy-D-xylo-4-hexulose-3-dehydrase
MFWKLQENVISESDLEVLIKFIRETKRFTQFSKVKEFEQAFAEWQGCKYCVLVNSGSSANLVLINALKELQKWRDGDEVIVPAVTWPTTITPVMQFGLKPVFVDVNLTDLSFDYEKIERAITPRTRGIFVAHLLGFSADINRLYDVIGGRRISIFEDCCESQGAALNGKKVGSLSEAGTFSFYWGHHMTTVEGGMLCTDSPELFKLFTLKRSHGLARELPMEYKGALEAQYSDIDFNFLFLTDGFNVRNTEFNAVLGLAQLKRIDEFIAIRNRNFRRFSTLCKRYPEELLVLEKPGMSAFVLPFFFHRKERKLAFQAVIRAAGIEFRSLIGGNLLRQPFLAQYYDPAEFPNSDFIHHNAFYIGNNQFVNDQRLDVLQDLMESFFAN